MLWFAPCRTTLSTCMAVQGAVGGWWIQSKVSVPAGSLNKRTWLTIPVGRGTYQPGHETVVVTKTVK